MLVRVVSGGQTGADQAGLRAAKACGLETGGWAPLGWLTEDGARPWLADFGLLECQEPGYPAKANARDSDATLWFGARNSSGYRATAKACRDAGRPMFEVVEGGTKPSDVAAWIESNGFRSVNCAGDRESSNPGIGDRSERFLTAVFRRLAED